MTLIRMLTETVDVQSSTSARLKGRETRGLLSCLALWYTLQRDTFRLHDAHTPKIPRAAVPSCQNLYRHLFSLAHSQSKPAEKETRRKSD